VAPLAPDIEELEQLPALVGNGGALPPEDLFDDGDSGSWRPGGRPQAVYSTGMLVGLGASSMFFLALVSASVVHRGMPGSDWMPLHPPSILWLTSALAIASSVTLVYARRSFKSGTNEQFARWWRTTAVLGICFLGGQIFAWRKLASAGVYMVSNPSVGFFYVFTVAHGLHLLGGVIALLWIGWKQSRGWKNSRGISAGTATAVAALYWHFVTVLWLCLFSFFLIGG
jgi:cytochrome c oxidase subunit 3